MRRLPITTADYPRKMLNLSKLLETYDVETLNVLYRHIEDGPKYITIPLDVNLFVMLKTYILHDDRDDTLIFSKNLIGVKNYFLTQLLDDHKNNRINVLDYYL